MDFLQLTASGLANGCIYGLIALGFVLIYKVTEQINFAQGDMMMLGAFLAIGLGNEARLGLPFPVACAGAVVLTAGLGWALERTALRAVFGAPQMAVAILTIAIGFVMRFAAGAAWGHDPQLLEGPFLGKQLSLGGVVLGLVDIAIVLATLLLTGVLYLYFRHAYGGLAMRAASQNQLAAYCMGISVRRVHGRVWALAGGAAAVAGILFASKGTVDPSAGLLGIKAFAAAVIGGLGSLPGALLGGVVIGLAEQFASRAAPPGFTQIAPYAVLILVLWLRPSGLLPQRRDKNA